jgi:hypothetical protein
MHVELFAKPNSIQSDSSFLFTLYSSGLGSRQAIRGTVYLFGKAIGKFTSSEMS